MICDILNFLGSQNWTSLLQGIGAIWVAIIATVALNQWKRQIKLQKQVDFVDQLTDEIHNFLIEAPQIISAIKFIKIGFESYSNTKTEYNELENNGAIAYIEKNGEQESRKLVIKIEKLRKRVGTINSLATKGQVYGIEKYALAKNSIDIIIHVFGQMEAFAYFIGNTNMYWENPKVQKTLNSVANIDETLMQTNLEQQNTEYLKFAQSVYSKM